MAYVVPEDPYCILNQVMNSLNDHPLKVDGLDYSLSFFGCLSLERANSWSGIMLTIKPVALFHGSPVWANLNLIMYYVDDWSLYFMLNYML